MPETKLALPKGYEALLRDLKERIRAAQVRAALAVNRELVLLYWSIGRDILARQKEHGWGAKVIDRLADDLRKLFPDMTGLCAPESQIYAGLRRGLAGRPSRTGGAAMCSSIRSKVVSTAAKARR